jgi:isocitrate dehydrogenase
LENQVVQEVTAVIKKYFVGIKCVTITADEARVKEFNLKQLWPSPNIAVRSASIPRLVQGRQKPIIIGRHAFSDQYCAKERVIQTGGRLEMVFTPEGGQQEIVEVHNFSQRGGVGLHQYNTAESIEEFCTLQLCLCALYKDATLF